MECCSNNNNNNAVLDMKLQDAGTEDAETWGL
jgi:hypothetical protein